MPVAVETDATGRSRPSGAQGSRIFDIQRYCVQDGPGIRTVVFLKGCPLRCPWCANPESVNTYFEVGHIDSLCNQCGDCLKVCDPKAISFTETAITIARDACTNCGKCIPVCAPLALRPFGREPFREETSLDEIFDEIRKDYFYFSKSGGGLTLSGGEVLSQPRFAAAIMKRAQALGIHTAIETSGYGSEAALDLVLEHTDLVLYDLKIMDSAAHALHIGVPNELIHRNARRVVDRKVPMVVRVPLIPGLTDTKENILAIGGFVKELDPKLSVHLLPYHRYGIGKFEMLDRQYELGDVPTQTEEELGAIVAWLGDLGVSAEIIR